MGQTNQIPCLVPPGDPRLNGKTYEQWASAWWQWALQMPLTNSAGAIHPLIDSPRFDVTASQTSDVWFLAAPFLARVHSTIERSCRIPSGKALFFPLFTVECSSIEAPPFYGATAEAQAAMAQSWADLIVDILRAGWQAPLEPGRLSRPEPADQHPCPSPVDPGPGRRQGHLSGDGYFVFLSPLPPGEHTLRFGGAMRSDQGEGPHSGGSALGDRHDLPHHRGGGHRSHLAQTIGLHEQTMKQPQLISIMKTHTQRSRDSH